jgi:AcrR family transcriptional regulator
MTNGLQNQPQEPITTRSAILIKAAQFFSQKGYAGTSMSDLAEDLGLSKAAIYHHFESKQSILMNLVQSTFQDMGVLVHEVESLPASKVNPSDVLRRFAEILFAHRQVVSLILFQLPSELRTPGIERREYMVRLQEILAGKKPTLERRIRARAATTIIATGIVPPPFGELQRGDEIDLTLLVRIAVDALRDD